MIYLVSNRKLSVDNFYRQIEEACKAGVDRIILREKDLAYEEYLKLARKTKEITDFYKTPLIVNGNLKVAKDIDAYAYHCPYKEFMDKGKSYKIQGVSVHSLEEGVEAYKNGADYLLAGHIFPTKCKEGLEPRGLSFIKNIKDRVDIPVIAIGGINHNTIGELYRNEIKDIAVMSYIMESENIIESVDKLRGGIKDV